MQHYIHCHQGYDLNKGGSVGYISSLYNSFSQFNSSFLTKDNIKCNFIFPNILPDERMPYQPLQSILDPRFCYVDNYELNNANKAFINQRRQWFREIIPITEYQKINSKNITSVHIHGAYNFLPIYNSLIRMGVESRVVKILTTHNPFKPECEDIELITRGRNFKKEDIEVFKYFYSQRDYWAFNLADALFFPTEESMEGYFETWPEFQTIVKNKPVFFCTTATERKNYDTSASVIRKELKIPSDATMLLYLGRFVNVRGYDILIEAAKKILSKNKNIYFVVVGESTRAPITSPNWIQLPFTKKPGNYINAADAVLCPNRGSLFDLSMIESLSLGKVIICNYVGGYKWLKEKISGVFYAERNNVDSFINAITEFCNTDKNRRIVLSNENRNFYESYLSLKNFQENYCSTIDNIYNYFEISDKYCSLSYCDKITSYPVANTSSVSLANAATVSQVKQHSTNNIEVDKNLPKLSDQKVSSKIISPTRRKLRKLVKNPKLYFKDLVLKRLK